MNLWERMTGSDMTKEWKAFDARAAALPDDHRRAWEQIKLELMPKGDFTGRNLTPIFDGVLGLLETTAADGLSAAEALGDDIPAFSAGLIESKGPGAYRDRWREQLNANVSRKLARLEH